MGRRIEEIVGSTTTDLYYSKDWQVLEERDNGVIKRQNVWGLGYVDQLVLRDRDADNNALTGTFGFATSGLEERLYAQQDANYNVTSISNNSGQIVERYIEDPYGKVTIVNGTADADGSNL